MEENKIRKVFLDEIPKCKSGTNKGKFNWLSSIGYFVHFICDDIEGDLKIIKYITKGQILTVEYNDKIFNIRIGNLMKCQLGRILGKITSDFKITKDTRYKDDKRDLTITDMKHCPEYNEDGILKQNIKWYKYHCNICNWDEGWMREGDLEHGKGCSCCYRRTPVLGINTIWDTDTWMIPIINDDEFCKSHTHGCEDEIFPICPVCRSKRDKKMKINKVYTYHSICCPKCGDGISMPNKMGYNILEQLGINFETEYNPKWCKYLYRGKLRQGFYDFYFKLNNKEYILEMDGGFHNNDNTRSGQTKEESKYIDDEKDRLAKEHDIEVIRIDCEPSEFEYIKRNILNNDKLNQLFDLSKIDWIKILNFVIFTRVKVACEYWNSGIYNTTKIAQIMKMNRTTICKYLKQGSELSWCNYDPKEASRKNSVNNGKNGGKPVEIFKDGISKGIFPSGTEIERCSKELFGIQLEQSAISLCCSGKQKKHKGYTFKYA